MTDFLEGMKVHMLSISSLLAHRSGRSAHSTAESSRISLFHAEEGAIHYFPTRIRLPKTDETLSLDEAIASNSAAEDDRVMIREHYITFGKVLNYLFREGMPIPSPFASPLLLLYLTSDPLEYDNASYALSYLGRYADRLPAPQLLQAIRDLDPSYQGTIRSYVGDGSSGYEMEAIERIYEEFIYPVIIRPNQSALLAIKEGFDYIPIANHLQVFTYDELYENFIGEDVYTWDDIRQHIDYGDAAEPIFEQRVSAALAQLDHEELRNLILLATGSTLFQRAGARPTTIKVKPLYKSLADLNKYPRWPLPTSRTCFLEIMIPFPGKPPSKASASSTAILSNGDKVQQQAIASLWTVENVLENIRGALHHSVGEFHDRASSA
jgi:hypothetical protein